MPTDVSADPGFALLAQVQHRTRAVIEAELRRLARRAPTLDRTELDAIEVVLEDLAESLVLARLRSASPDAVPLLSRLFDIS